MDVALAQRPWTAKAASTPSKPPSPKLHDKKVGEEASVAAITIRKEMYLHEPMVKS